GRETLIDLLLEKVKNERFLAVFGPSGSGKSSVVLAGLLPALKRGLLPGSQRWRYQSFKPGARPMDAIAAALSQIQGGNLGNTVSLRDILAQSDRALLLAADMLGVAQLRSRLVLVVDQFEELWTQAPTEPEARKSYISQQQEPFIRLL